MGSEPLDATLFETVAPAVKSALAYVRMREAAGGCVATHDGFPELAYFENGMPRFGIAWGKEPRDYSRALDRELFFITKESQYDLRKQPEFLAVKAYFRDNAKIWEHCFASRADDDKALQDSMLETEVKLFIAHLVDRYIHYYHDADFSTSNLLPIYLPLEAGFLLEKLPVNVWVPILFVGFDIQELELEAGSYIRRIPEGIQLSRVDKKTNSPAIHEVVKGAATHAFVLTGYELANSTWGEWAGIANSVDAYPTDKVELLFAMLRLATGVDTGYAQLLLEPIDWARSYKATLPPLEGTAVRRYPAMFEAFYWNQPTVPSVDLSTLKQVVELYRGFVAIAEDKIKSRMMLALRRLNACLLRENEEDAILDVTGAMEVLLTPGDNAEITHKLATRLASLARFVASNEPPITVFRNIKQIYRHRSNVIHGNVTKLEKSKEIRINDAKIIPIVKLAADYLRLALQVLIKRPEYLDPNRIDEEMLLASLVASRSDSMSVE